MKPRSYDWWVTKLTEMMGVNDSVRRQAIHEIAAMFAADDERRRKPRAMDFGEEDRRKMLAMRKP